MKRAISTETRDMGKAVAHMLVLADIYAGRSMQDQADSVLRTALELDPGNAAQSRLGIAPPTLRKIAGSARRIDV
jgi:hypothetical protein